MAGLREFRDQLLRDKQITSNEVDVIQSYIQQDGQLDYDDIKFLVGLMKEADSVCPEFDALLFPAMRQVILSDGEVTMDEQYLLLQMLYSDGEVRECERQFIAGLRNDVRNVTPELNQLCETAMSCESRGWDTGGRPRS